VGRERLVKNEHLVPIIRGSTSRGAHVRAIWEALTCLIDDIPAVPSSTRVRLRAQRAVLERTYPGELGVNASQLAQEMAEEDGIPQEDLP
jgi:hypothetical protein